MALLHPFYQPPTPRLDPYGVLPLLERMDSRQIGVFMQAFVWRALNGTADNRMRHVLDLCGWALSCREASV
jgi:hypothetical protein